MSPTVQELYELWADEAELNDALQRSLAPRGLDSLFEAFAALGPKPGQLVVDAGARNAVHTIRLVREHGLRGIAVDVVPLHRQLARTAIDEAGPHIKVVRSGNGSAPRTH